MLGPTISSARRYIGAVCQHWYGADTNSSIMNVWHHPDSACTEPHTLGDLSAFIEGLCTLQLSGSPMATYVTKTVMEGHTSAGLQKGYRHSSQSLTHEDQLYGCKVPVNLFDGNPALPTPLQNLG